MARGRSASLLVLLATALIVTGVASTLVKQVNPIQLPTGLNVASNAESTALYCTGLSSSSGGVVGHVAFLNTTNATRTLSISVVSDTHQTATRLVSLAARATVQIQPDHWVHGDNFAMAAQVDGGGVVGEEVTSDASAQVPCASAGVADWFGSGFDTLVGSSAALSIYNPTATPAVIDVTAFTSNGFVAPATLQGLAVGAHQQVELNLGTPIVNSSNIGVHVRVVRGSIAVVGVQRSGHVVSFDPGSTTIASSAWFPRVTTVARAVSEIRLANPGSLPANVTVNISLSPFTVASETVTVAPFSSGDIVLSPNSAIPAAGYANVTVKSSAPVIASLATGTSSGIALSPSQTPSTTFLLSDFSGKGFDAATITNTTSHPISVIMSTIPAKGVASISSTVRLAGATTSDILGVFNGVTSLTTATILVTTSRPTLLLTATLPTIPVGVTVVSPLYGG